MQRDGSINLNKYQIRAIEELGLTLDQLEGHNWESNSIAEITIEYLCESEKNDLNLTKAMNLIRGAKNSMQIAAISYGLSRQKSEEFDWDNVMIAQSLLFFIKLSKKLGEDISDSVNKIIDKEDHLAIERTGLNIDIKNYPDHDWNNTLIRQATIKYLRKVQKEGREDLGEVMKNIEGLNYFQIKAIGLGVTKDQFAYNDWDNYSTSHSITTYLKHKPDSLGANDVMANVRNKNYHEIMNLINLTKDSIKLGFSKEQVYSIDNFSLEKFNKLKEAANAKYFEKTAQLVGNIVNLSNKKYSDTQIDIPAENFKFLDRQDLINLSLVNKENAQEAKIMKTAIKAIDVKQLFAEKQQEHHR